MASYLVRWSATSRVKHLTAYRRPLGAVIENTEAKLPEIGLGCLRLVSAGRPSRRSGSLKQNWGFWIASA
ncbi:hypothetical protein [Catenulispora pinisilvae]|nr:hypothetical protein [Catenulispora pinisilvae]